MTRKILMSMIVICMVIACIPLTAGAEETVQQAEIKMTVGSTSATINGAAAKVQPPVKANGTMLVPLNAVAKAFGIDLAVQKDTITLQYNSLAAALTIGSNVVKVNGVKSKLASAPKRMNGVSMVPMRLFSEFFGAAVVLKGNDITITGSKNTGYTKVGDSYYGWSMNYPIGMHIRYQSDTGESVNWYDSIGNWEMGLEIVDANNFEDVLDIIIGDDTIVEKESIVIHGVSFNKWVTKGRYSDYIEYRFTKKDDKVYILSAGDTKARTRGDLIKYKSQLDSFRLAFSKSDKKMKDITRIRNGKIVFQDTEYGLHVDLPMNWTRASNTDNPIFQGEDGSLEIVVVSASGSETAEQWSARSEEKLGDQFVDGYLSNVTRYPIKLNKEQGYVLQYDHKVDEKKWMRAYTIYYISGDHKYEGLLTCPIGDSVSSQIERSRKLFESVAGSMTFDTNYVDNNLGYIEDKSARDGEFVKMRSKASGYALEMPAEWHNFGEDVSPGFVNVKIPRFGIFQITVNPVQPDDHFEQQLLDAGFRKTEVEINGIPSIRLDMEDVIEEVPVRTTLYMVKHKGTRYNLYFRVNQANDTPSFRADEEKVVQSLTFTS